MPKSRKTKAKYKDIQKKQLRKGPLPKGLNDTQISFKSRRIVIQDQLKGGKTANEPLSRRKLSIQELLVQCLHYSTSVRNDAVTELLGLIGESSEALATYLPSIVGKIVELFHDVEPTVRHAVQRLLKVLFQNTPLNRLEPFAALFAAHLSCAMTSIHNDVQADALRFFDIFIEYYPAVITGNTSQLMRNFIELISSQSKDATKKRILDLSLGKKASGIKWQGEVLGRLVKLLASGDSSSAKTTQQELPTNSSSLYWNQKQSFTILGTVSFEHVNSCQSVRPNLDASLQQLFVDTLLPLLFGCWSECSAAMEEESGSVVDNLTVMSHAVAIIRSVLFRQREFAESSSEALRSIAPSVKTSADLVHKLASSFPVSVPQVFQKTKKEKGFDVESVVRIINLTLSDCLCLVASNHFANQASTSSSVPAWLADVTQHTVRTLRDGKLTAKQTETVVSILRLLTRRRAGHEADREMLLAAVVNYCKTRSLKSEVVTSLVLFLCDIVDSEPVTHLNTGALHTWLQSLPHLLASAGDADVSVAARLLSTLSTGLRQGVTDLSHNLDLELPRLLSQSTNLLTVLPPALQCSLMSLLWWLPELSQPVLASLSAAAHRQALSSPAIGQLVTIVVTRSGWNSSSHNYCVAEQVSIDSSVSFSFLLSLCAGISRTSLDAMSTLELSSVGAINLVVAENLSWPEHVAKTAIIQQALLSCDRALLMEALSRFLPILTKCNTLPVHTVYSMLYVADRLFSPGDLCRLSQHLMRLLLSLAMWSLVTGATGEAASVTQQCVDLCHTSISNSPLLLDNLLLHLDNTVCDVNAVRLLSALVGNISLHPAFRQCLFILRDIAAKCKVILDEAGQSELWSPLQYNLNIIGCNF